MKRTTLTAAGWTVLAGAVGALVLGWATGDNVILLVGCALAAPLLVDAWLGRRALDGVRAYRLLPDPVFAGQPAAGHLVVEAPNAGTIAARCVEGGVGGGATAADPRIAVAWHFPTRGRHTLGPIALWTRWPLGLLRRECRVDRPVEVLVAPRPRPHRPQEHPDHGARDHDDGARRGPIGELLTLRPYAPGDRIRAVHWPTSARTGVVTVVDRGRGWHREPWVVVPATDDPQRWERALEAACGAILATPGPIGLDLAGERVGPGTGGPFRRQLLARLADAPRIGG